MLSLDPLNLAQQAIAAAHAKGIQALSQDQFDALFLVAQGLEILKRKYKADPVFTMMQEDLLVLLGVGVDQNYLLEKKKLEEETAKKINTSYLSWSIDAIQQDAQMQINKLRERYQVDAQISAVLNQCVTDVKLYKKFKENYSTHLGMHYIEEDIDVKQKQAHESEAEFKTKQIINQNYKYYNEKRKDYIKENKNIEDVYEKKLEMLYMPIQPDIDRVNNQYDDEMKKLKARDDNFLRLFPAEKMLTVKENNFQIKVALESNKDTPDELLQRQQIEELTNKLLLENKELLGNKKPIEISDFIFKELALYFEQEKKQMNKKRVQEINKLENAIQKEVTVLQKEKEAKLKNNKIAHQVILNEAEAYFDANVLPYIKELKAQEANKYFSVIANEIAHFIEGNTDSLQGADSDTIGFVVLMKAHLNKLVSRAMLQHVGLKVAKEAVEDEIKAQNLENKKQVESGLVQQIINHVANKIANQAGEAIADALNADEKPLLAMQVNHMEKVNLIKVPDIIEGYQEKTMHDYYVEPAVKMTKGGPASFFDFVSDFNKQKGFVDTSKAMYRVYQAMTADNPDMALVDAPSTAHLFAQAMKDEVLRFNYTLLMQYKKLIEVLNKHDQLGVNAAASKKLLEEMNVLENEREALDIAYKNLQEAHPLFRKKYTEAKNNLANELKKLEPIKKEAITLSEEIKKLKMQKKAAELSIPEKLPLSAQNEIHENIKKLDVKYNTLKEKEEKITENKMLELNADYDKKIKALNVFDTETQLLVENFKMEYIESACKKGLNAVFFVTEDEKKQYLQNHPEIFEQALQAVQGLAVNRTQQRVLIETQYKNQWVENKSKYEKIGKEKIENLAAAKAIEYDKIAAPFIAINKQSEEMQERIQRLENTLSENKAFISTKENNIKANQEKAIIEISREFYRNIQELNELKETVNRKTNIVLNKALQFAEDEPHLAVVHSMARGAHASATLFANVDKHLPAVLDGLDVQTMTYDDVAKKSVAPRDIKEVNATAEEKALQDKVKDNLVQIGGATIVEGITEQAVKTVEAYVSHLDNTLDAQQKLQVEQQRLNKEATDLEKFFEKQKDERNAELGNIKKGALVQRRIGEIQPRVPAVHQSGFQRFLEKIATFFRYLKNALVGSSKEQLQAKEVLDNKMVPEVVVESYEKAQTSVPPYRKLPVAMALQKEKQQTQKEQMKKLPDTLVQISEKNIKKPQGG